MIETLIAFFKKSSKETKENVPEGLCPNCWGSQEYGNQLREMYQDNQINVNNKSENHTFIKNFVVKYVDGIKLKKGKNSIECPTCKLKV